MKQYLNSFFFRDPSKWQFWILVSLVCKGLIFIFILSKHDINTIPGFWGATGGDTDGYITPIDNLIKYGQYSPDFRMPGYGIIYLPFALLFSKPLGPNLLIIFQFIMAALSVYPLALIARHLFKSAFIFYTTFYLFAVSTYSNLFDSMLLTESLSTSFLIFSVFFLLQALKGQRKSRYILSGILLTEVIFMRPVFIPLLALYALVIFINQKQTFLPKLLLFLVPFICFEGLWITRNYLSHKKFIPLTVTFISPGIEKSYKLPFIIFVQSWGGSWIWWDPTAEIRWFGVKETRLSGMAPLKDNNISIPDYIYTSKFNLDSLVILKQQLTNYLSDSAHTISDSIKREELMTIIRNKCNLYAQSIKYEKPFLYYIKAPLVITKKFLVHSGTYNLFDKSASELSPVAYVFKIFYSLLYLLVIGLGIIGLLLLTKQSISFASLILITGTTIYCIIIHPIILRYSEARYLVPVYPFMIICVACTVNWIYIKFRVKRST